MNHFYLAFSFLVLLPLAGIVGCGGQDEGTTYEPLPLLTEDELQESKEYSQQMGQQQGGN